MRIVGTENALLPNIDVFPLRHGWMVGAILLVLCSGVNAQDWAKKMFGGTTTHDFGVVARGAKAEYSFVVENIYEEDAHIKSVVSSCQCSKPRITKQSLKTWEKSEIVVGLDTRAEPGRKDGTLEVDFDRPYPAKVQLHVHSFIRGDVVVQPGVVEFGSVNQGAGATRDLKITYAGRSDWKIKTVECANPYIKASFVESSRTPGASGTPNSPAAPGRVAYKVSVELKKDAPSGYIREPLVLVTNDVDTKAARVPVNIEGLVSAAIMVRPSSLTMGAAEIGKPVTSNLVVQGRVAFRIVAIHPDDDRFSGKLPEASKTFHIVPITFLAKDAGTPPGRVTAKIHIETDLKGASPVEVVATVEVVP
jgi:hypothetical protein